MKLVVIDGPDKGSEFAITPGAPWLIGRSKDTQTRLTDPRVSRVHCEVHVEGSEAMVIDSNGAGGTLVNGKRVNQQKLQPGDVIQIGHTQLRFQAQGAAEETTVDLPPKALPRPAKKPIKSLDALVGQVLSHFEIGPLIARGQSGAVFRARDNKEDHEVALKVLAPEFSKKDDEMQRFIRAMRTMLPLRHPNTWMAKA